MEMLALRHGISGSTMLLSTATIAKNFHASVQKFARNVAKTLARVHSLLNAASADNTHHVTVVTVAPAKSAIHLAIAEHAMFATHHVNAEYVRYVIHLANAERAMYATHLVNAERAMYATHVLPVTLDRTLSAEKSAYTRTALKPRSTFVEYARTVIRLFHVKPAKSSLANVHKNANTAEKKTARQYIKCALFAEI